MNSLKIFKIFSFSVSLFLVLEVRAAQINFVDIAAVHEFEPLHPNHASAKRKITIDYSDNVPLKRPQKKQVKDLIKGQTSVTCKFSNYQNQYCTNQVNSFERYLKKHYLNIKVKK